MQNKTDNCKLCLQPKKLCRSHIIPDLCYKPIKDSKGRIQSIKANPHVHGPSTLQSGIWEQLLCADCEKHLNLNFEIPFKQFWIDQAPLPDHVHGLTSITAPDYRQFKLFHNSILFRAGVSSHQMFSNVYLADKHRDRLRDMLLNCDAGTESEYPVACAAIVDQYDRVMHDFIPQPYANCNYGMNSYCFIFSGCLWVYFCSSHIHPNVKQLALQPDGTLNLIPSLIYNNQHITDAMDRYLAQQHNP